MNDLHQLIWIGTNLISMALALGVAILMVRHRRRHRWLILTGAIAFAAAAIFSTLHLTGSLLELDGHLARWFGWLRYSGFAYSWGLILLLLGVFLQSLRSAGESKRIAELEAILHDQHRPIPPGDER